MEKFTNNNSSSRLWCGLIILVVGLVFFLKNFGVNIPHWVISWHVLLIAIGLLVGYKRNFNGGGWLIMVLIGGFFTLEDIGEFDLSKYYFAIAFIILGLFMIFKPKRTQRDKERWKKRWHNKHSRFGEFNESVNTDEPKVYTDIDKDDILDSVNVFGGSHQNVYSKNFKGGDVIAIFGGSDINLTQADFEGTIVLDVVAIFGGLKIVIPPSWEVKSEVTAIFGGMDDKRAMGQVIDGPRKILLIKGVALFGGVDIRNF
nr:LiaF domain-containing protein [Pedobacter panaciterrae]